MTRSFGEFLRCLRHSNTHRISNTFRVFTSRRLELHPNARVMSTSL